MRKFNFDLYRLNIVDVIDIFIPKEASPIRTDEKIIDVLEKSDSPVFDKEQETRGAIYKWSIRDCYKYPSNLNSREVVSLVLARSVLEKNGLIVTDDGMSSGLSSSFPPLASTIILFFDLSRHLVAVEHSSELSQTAWKDYLEKILSDTALQCGYASQLTIEPVPEKTEILSLFRSFDRVTRIKATLRIPNPELTRYTKSLFDDLKHSNIREYMQDMKSPSGLSTSEDARPFATAVLAQQGYKKGDVHIEGIRGDKFEKVDSGSVASRGSISILKDFVRGLNANAKAKETISVLSEITKEIDRIHPIDFAEKNE